MANRFPRRTIIFLGIGLIAYLIGLIALIPARAVLDDSDGLAFGGTIWNGEGVLASTVRFDWRFSPITSISNLGFSADWHLSGGGTDLAGSATKRGSTVELTDISGQADGTLLNALAPKLPFQCEFLAEVAIQRLRLGGDRQEAEGALRTSSTKCAATDLVAPPLDLPPMRAEIIPRQNMSGGALITAADKMHLVEFRFSSTGALSIWPTSMAVQLAPILSGQRFDTIIE